MTKREFKMKIIEIRNCGECPYRNYLNWKLCNKGLRLDDVDTQKEIHPDCPLKDSCSPKPNMYDVVCK